MTTKNKVRPIGIILGSICLTGALLFLITAGAKNGPIIGFLIFLGIFFIANAQKGKSISQTMTTKVNNGYYADFWYKFTWWSIPVFILLIIYLIYLKSTGTL